MKLKPLPGGATRKGWGSNSRKSRAWGLSGCAGAGRWIKTGVTAHTVCKGAFGPQDPAPMAK